MSEGQQPPHLALTHGQVLWVLARERPPSPKLQQTVKYLRKLGVPFRKDELGRGRGVRVVYGYEHLVELEMARLLRARGMDLGDVAEALVWLRDQLRPLYRRAYVELSTGLGAPTVVVNNGGSGIWRKRDGSAIAHPVGQPMVLQGCYLDLGLAYEEDGRITHNPIRLLGPWDTIQEISTMGRDYTYRGFIALSQITFELVDLALRAPEIKPGPA